MKTLSELEPAVAVKNGIDGRGLFATRKINKNTIIFRMYGEYSSQPTQTSIQVGDNMHIEDALGGLLNHNCNPSAKVDRQLQAIISLRDIEPNEEITFNYNSNEDCMAAPFVCKCCGNEIFGKKTM